MKPSTSADITLLDYGLGNLGSLSNLLHLLGATTEVTADRRRLEQARSIILPGVGAYDEGMTRLAKSGLLETLNYKALDERVPILGICLGFQLMTLGSEEGLQPGLGWLDAQTVRLSPSVRIPNVGWRNVKFKGEHRLWNEIDNGDNSFYFMHSFYPQFRRPLTEPSCNCTYQSESFLAGIVLDNLMGVQFHPEKSHRSGKIMLSNFIALARKAACRYPRDLRRSG